MTTDIKAMLAAQLELQVESFGRDPRDLNPDERAEFIRWNVLALEDELHEALNEVGWKPWATNRDVNVELFVKEMVDAWHFFMNLLLAVHGPGATPEIIAERFCASYFAKRQVNAQRQEDGYDGVETKCPACKRALDDAGLQRYGQLGGEHWYACGGCGKVIPTLDIPQATRDRATTHG